MDFFFFQQNTNNFLNFSRNSDMKDDKAPYL